MEDPATVAAVMVEPIGHTGGIIDPPPEYLRILRDVCDRHNVLLIFDEIITGAGRTGHLFAAETFGVTPDVLCTAKGLSGGYAPLSAMICTQRIADTFWGPIEENPGWGKLLEEYKIPMPSSYFNFNLVAMDVSVDFVVRMGPELVAAHNQKLIELLFDRLPKDRFVPASPLDALRRGPYGCFAARSPEKTAEHYQRLRKENVAVSLREGNIRVSPHLYNTERDIDRLISVVTP